MDFYLGISYLKDNDEPWTDAELRDWKEAHCQKVIQVQENKYF